MRTKPDCPKAGLPIQKRQGEVEVMHPAKALLGVVDQSNGFGKAPVGQGGEEIAEIPQPPQAYPKLMQRLHVNRVGKGGGAADFPHMFFKFFIKKAANRLGIRFRRVGGEAGDKPVGQRKRSYPSPPAKTALHLAPGRLPTNTQPGLHRGNLFGCAIVELPFRFAKLGQHDVVIAHDAKPVAERGQARAEGSSSVVEGVGFEYTKQNAKAAQADAEAMKRLLIVGRGSPGFGQPAELGALTSKELLRGQAARGGGVTVEHIDRLAHAPVHGLMSEGRSG